jgi:hypothetical protein
LYNILAGGFWVPARSRKSVIKAWPRDAKDPLMVLILLADPDGECWLQNHSASGAPIRMSGRAWLRPLAETMATKISYHHQREMEFALSSS